MDKKMAVLIIAVFILLCIGSYLIFEPGKNLTYHKINLTDSCTADVPVTDKVSTYTDNLNIYYYSDYENNLNITSFNNGSQETASQGMLRLDNLKQDVMGTEKMTNGNFTYYRNNKLGTYTLYVEDPMSNNTILLSSSDLTVLNKVYNSLQASVVVENNDYSYGQYSYNSY